MNTLSKKIGFWSALFLTLVFIAWIVCFIGISFSSPVFYWTNIGDYLTYSHTYNQSLQYIAKFFMLIFGPLYVLLINSFYDHAKEEEKAWARISLLFGLAFAILSSLHYFVQLSAVRLNILHGQVDGLANYVQANPYSIMTSADMLGWTLFLGLSSVFISPVFKENRLDKTIRYAFVFNGLFCMLGGIGYIFQIDLMTFIFINIGAGGALLTVCVASMKKFKRLKLLQ